MIERIISIVIGVIILIYVILRTIYGCTLGYGPAGRLDDENFKEEEE